MLDSFGSALRTLRERQGLSLRALARKASITAGHLTNLESGRRPPTPEAAAVCDQALGSAPLLRVLCEIEKGDAMRRRILLGGTFAAAAGALLSAADTTAALAATLDSGLRAAGGAAYDWDRLAADFTRRHRVAPSAELGHELAAQLAVAQHFVVAGDPDATRGAAQLALIYGLWLGDMNRIPTAHALYDTATALADRSTDPGTRAWVRARAASRGVYEGWPARRALDGAGAALAIDPAGPAAVEAHATRVHVAALVGDLEAGRTAVRAMYDVAAGLPTDGASAWRRAVEFDTYFTCRTGTLADAQRVYERARTELAAVPMWLADASIYLGLALVAAGDVRAGAATALQAVQAADLAVPSLGWGVRDVLAKVPAKQQRLAEVVELRGYAAHGPAPWETVMAA